MTDTPTHERLGLMIEEMGEALQIAGKILRHGWNSSNPLVVGADRVTNKMMLEEELAHVEAAMDLLSIAGDIDHHAVRRLKQAKFERLTGWLHHTKNIEICARRAEDMIDAD
jgi:hypothetical protein